jgi:DNA-binding MarR family transcriptional regulator
MDNAVAPDPVEVTLDVVTRLARLVAKLLESDAQAPMTVRQFRILARLAQGEHGVGRLAAGAGVGSPSMSEAIDNLVGRGWVHRVEDPEDRRRKAVGLTPDGDDARRHAEAVLRTSVAELLEELTDADREAVGAGLHALGRVLDRRWAEMMARVTG